MAAAKKSGLMLVLEGAKKKASSGMGMMGEEAEEGESADSDREYTDAFDTFWDAVQAQDKDTAREALHTAIAACEATEDAEETTEEEGA